MLDNRQEGRRTAGRKQLNIRRDKISGGNERLRVKNRRTTNDIDSRAGSVDLPLKEHRDSAIVRGVGRIVMNERVQRGKSRHRLQHKKDQQAKRSSALSGVPQKIALAQQRHHDQRT